MTADLSRRTLLGLVAGSSLGLLVGGCSLIGGDESGLSCDDLDGVYEASAGLVAIGTRYRELYPDDDPGAAADALALDEADGQAPDLAEALAGQVRADFDADDVVDVDGWVLARTEARIAALLADC